jgi:hypothetical protein
MAILSLCSPTDPLLLVSLAPRVRAIAGALRSRVPSRSHGTRRCSRRRLAVYNLRWSGQASAFVQGRAG